MGKPQGLRILHSGDIYLGRPFPLLPAKSSERRRAETMQTFKELLRYVEEQRVHLVLLSGNLFDFDYVGYETVSYVMREMERMSFAEFLIAPGTADQTEKQSFYNVCHLPKNVHVFGAKAEFVHFPQYRVSVWGWGISPEQAELCPMAKIPEYPKDHSLLVCGYAAPAGQGGSQVSPDEIASSGAAYVGLSGGEGFFGFSQLNDTVTAFSGHIESSSFADVGFGGANYLVLQREGEIEEIIPEEEEKPDELAPAEQMTYFEDAEEKVEEEPQIAQEEQKPLVEFDIKEGKLIAERLLFGGRQYITEVIDITPFSTVEEVEQALSTLIRDKGYGTETSLCIILKGHTTPEFMPPRLRDHTAHGLAELLSMDKTVPDKDENEYVKDMSIRGELMRAMMPAILNGEEKSKENAIKALRIAFLALDNNEVHHI